MDIQKIIDTKQKHEKSLFKKANVVSVGCGYKFTAGKQTEEVCIVVGVSDKLPVAIMAAKDIVPASLDGIPTDVVKTGKFKSLQAIDPTKKFRPAIPGTSIGHKDITAGTFGCVVKRDGVRLILSNNHVLANSNDATIGDAIYQPGPIDGGTSADKIGTLFEFIPIDFGGGGEDPAPPTCPIATGTAGTANLMAAILGRKHRLMAFNTDPLATTNLVDAALALPEDSDVTEDIVQIGKPGSVGTAPLGTEVQKYGRTTRYTTGVIIQTNVTVQVSYGPGKIATFIDQLMSGAMSAGGDSGSVLLDMEKQLVGLLYAGSESNTIFNRIQNVFSSLNVSL